MDRPDDSLKVAARVRIPLGLLRPVEPQSARLASSGWCGSILMAKASTTSPLRRRRWRTFGRERQRRCTPGRRHRRSAASALPAHGPARHGRRADRRRGSPSRRAIRRLRAPEAGEGRDHRRICSVNRTTRSGTLPTLFARRACLSEHVGAERLRHVVPRGHRSCDDGLGALLSGHRVHLGRSDHGASLRHDHNLPVDPDEAGLGSSPLWRCSRWLCGAWPVRSFRGPIAEFHTGPRSRLAWTGPRLGRGMESTRRSGPGFLRTRSAAIGATVAGDAGRRRTGRGVRQ